MELTTERRTAPIIASQKEEILNPESNAATISRTTPFITKRKIPNVTTSIGKEMKISTGFTIALHIPSKMPARTRLQRFSNRNPCKILLTTKKETILIAQELKTFI
jgi:hypothetical protein